jgi:hypothetical protein
MDGPRCYFVLSLFMILVSCDVLQLKMIPSRSLTDLSIDLRQNNTLVSSDNKGMAAFLYENSVEPGAMPGNATFVAGFTQCRCYLPSATPTALIIAN